MLGFAVLTFGMLVSFVFASIMRNQREGRGNSLVLASAGYIVAGMLITSAALLLLAALLFPSTFSALAAM